MMFKLDFDASSSYFVKKEISYLKKYIPCSQTALVCNGLARPDQTAQFVSVMIKVSSVQVFPLIFLSSQHSEMTPGGWLLTHDKMAECKQCRTLG